MFKRNLLVVWVGILAVSGMFLMGQEDWGQVPDLCAGIDCGEHGSCVAGICECVDDYTGDVCEISPCQQECADARDAAYSECDVNYNISICGGDPTCEEAINEQNATCKADADSVYEGCITDCSPTWYEDADRDDYGNALSSTTAPTAPEGYVDNDLDCDDTDASAYPGAFELADNIDNDCVNGVDDGINERYIFASSSIHTGDFAQHDLVGGDGLTGADIFCQDLADNSTDLPAGIYKAWLSTSTMNAADRLTHSSFPYVLQNGTVVADDWSALVNTTTTPLQNPINLDQNGDAPVGNYYKVAFTGTNGLGEALAYTCSDWTDANATGVHGGYHSTDGEKWTVWDYTAISCWYSSQVYCLQQ